MNIAILDQQTNALRVYGLRTGFAAGSEVWEYRVPWAEILQDARPRQYNGRPVVLLACSLRCAALVDAQTKQTLWLTRQAADNPHAMELLPGGIAAVACSDGGALCLFDLRAADSTASAFTVPLWQPHGLWYDAARDRLWVLSYTHLHLLRVQRTPDGIAAAGEAAFPLPDGEAGHDLWPVAGSGGRLLWVTFHEHVRQFDTHALCWRTDYPGAALIDRPHTKGIGSFADGSVVSLIPDGGYHPWTAASAALFRPLPDGSFAQAELVFEGRASYKVRTWAEDHAL